MDSSLLSNVRLRGDIAPVDVGAVAGEDEITIKAAVITIAEAVS